MNNKELNELIEYNQEYMDARLSEDVFGGDYTSEVELKYLKKDYDNLQTRWNSLREWLENEKLQMEGYFDTVLDKMNELEGEDNK